MNHLLSDSPWNYQDVLADLCIKTSEVLSGTGQEVGLLIDEVGFRKKGRHSACVGRQYLGCIGKHDNGQVAVVAGLSSGKYYCPIDVALFMPKSWQDDHIRRKKAKIPENIQHQSKPDMAGAMIASMRKMAINFDYVAFDALYGNSFDLLSALHAENILFVGDVRDNVKISVEPITYSLPEKPPHSKGRKFKHKRVDQALTSLSQYCGQLGLEDFKQLHFRDGTKQKISAYFHQKEIWLPIGNQQTLRLQLIIRKDLDGKLKYSLANMHQESLLTIAKRQGQRVFVEKIFEEGKNQIGMGDYQVRSWTGLDYPETAYKRAMGIIQLHRTYGSQRLDKACERALFAGTCSYKRISNILKNNQDQYPLPEQQSTSPHIPSHENLRGASAYK
jgi:SRSO17 transposase